MAIRGCANYVFYVDQRIGSGVHGDVYFGRNKKTGEECAVKLYKNDSIKILATDIDKLHRLKHENVLCFLTPIDYESRLKNILIVYEFCNEKSLHDLLERPEYKYGLSPHIYNSLVVSVVRAVDYLHSIQLNNYEIYFTPTNILCHKTPNQDYIFKISDFGLKSLLTETLKILDPYIVSIISVLYLNNVNKLVWSYGCLLFHAATGMLPFQGDKNENTHALNKKENNMICYIFDKSKKLKYYSNLPYSNSLTQGDIRQTIELIIKKTIGNITTQLLWSDINKRILNLTELFYVNLLNASTGKTYELGLPKNAKTKKYLQDRITEVFTIANQKMQINIIHPEFTYNILQGKDNYSNNDNSSELSTSFLRTHVHNFKESPVASFILMYDKCYEKLNFDGPMNSIDCYVASLPMPNHQTTDKKPNLSEDFNWSITVSSTINLIATQLPRLSEMQGATLAVCKKVVRAMEDKVNRVRSRIVLMASMRCRPASINDEELIGLRNAADSRYKLEYFKEKFEKRNWESCESARCGQYFDNCLRRTDVVVGRFLKEKEAAEYIDANGAAAPSKMTYNDEQMHRYDKYKLKGMLEAAQKRISLCAAATQNAFDFMIGMVGEIDGWEVGKTCDKIENSNYMIEDCSGNSDSEFTLSPLSSLSIPKTDTSNNSTEYIIHSNSPNIDRDVIICATSGFSANSEFSSNLYQGEISKLFEIVKEVNEKLENIGVTVRRNMDELAKIRNVLSA